MKIIFLFISLLIFVSCSAQQKFLQVELFPSQEEHTHGSTIVELANGDMLAASISEDEGKTWKYTRHIELDPTKKNRFSYPSIIQGKDGTVHVIYTYQKYDTSPYYDDTIKYIRFTEEWIKEGDK